MKRGLSRAIDAALFAGVAFGLALYGRRYIPGALDSLSRLSAWRMAVCCLFTLSGYILRFSMWQSMAGSFGLRASPTSGARAFFVSFLGRYVPGNVGLMLARMRAYGSHPSGVVALATAAEYAALAASALFLVSFEAGVRASAGIQPAVWPLGATALILALLHPFVLRRASGLAWRMFRRSPPSDFPSWGRMASCTAGYALNGVLNGTALFMVLRGMIDLPCSLLPLVISRYYIAGLAGGVAAFAPAGLGIREGVLVASLAGISGAEPALAAALVMRLVTVSLELLLAGASVLAAGGARRDQGRRAA